MLLVVKPTLRCNAACTYCASIARAGVRDMDPATVDLLLDRAAELGRARGEPVTLLWHGGEPLLLGAAFFARVAARTRELAAAGVRLRHEVQTNLTLLDDEAAAVLAGPLAVGGLGTSFDPFSGNRRLAAGGDYQVAWRAGYRRARGAGLRVGALLTVDRAVLARLGDAWLYHRNFVATPSLRVNVVYPLGRARAAGLEVDAEAWGEALVALADLWDAEGRPGSLAPIAGWVDRAEGRPTRLSCDCGNCPGDLLGVGPGGEVYHCGRALDAGLPPLGHLATAPLAAALDAPARREFAERRARLAAGACHGCDFLDRCGGGCTVLALAVGGGLAAPDPWCAGRRRLFAHLQRRAARAA